MIKDILRIYIKMSHMHYLLISILLETLYFQKLVKDFILFLSVENPIELLTN